MSDERNGNGEHPNAELMRLMGSKKGGDPIPPDQYLCFLTSKDPRQRALAWVRSKTIRHKHRSPFCVDEQGKVITLSHMALDFGWDLGFASRIMSQLEAMKLVAKDGLGRICLCGEVPDLIDQRELDPLDCTVNLPPYIQLQINNLTPVRRAAFERKWKAFSDFTEAVKRDAIAAARSASAPFESRLFAEFDLRKKPGKKSRNGDQPMFVQLTLLAEPDYDEQSTDDSVQPPDANSYSDETASAQPTNPGASINTEDPEFREEHAAAASSSSLPAEPAAADPPPEHKPDPRPDLTPIIEAFKPIGGITDSTARKLIRDTGGATPEHIGAKATQEIARIRRLPNITNPTGLVIEHLRQFFHSPGPLAQWLREYEEIEVKESAANRRAEERERERQELFEQLLKEEVEKAGGGS
jgi:hypothetical protein